MRAASEDLGAGLLFSLIGALAIAFGRDYQMGTASSMGPGYVPIVLAGILLLIGVFLILRAILFSGEREGSEEEAGGGFAYRTVATILGAVLVFAAIVDRVGLALAAVALVFICRAAAPNYDFREVLITALVLSALSVVIFVYGLGMPVKPFPF